MAGFQLPFGVKPVNAVPVDFYSGPYISNVSLQDAIDLANSEIPIGIRFKTMEVRLIVNGIGAKYWYRDGVADINLVEFTTSTSFYLQGGTTYSSDTTSNIYRTGAVNIGSNATGSSTAKLYVSSNQPGAFRLEDGTQGPGYLLTSDINGVAGWTSSNSSFYIQGGTTYSFDTTSSIYRTGSLNIGTGTAANGRFVVSSSTGSTSLVVDEQGNVYNNSRGSANTLFGYRALYSNTSGYSNTAFGRFALNSNIIGAFNTAVGINTLFSNDGDYNTAVGINTLYYNTIGDMNTSIGAYSLFYNTLGNYNAAMGCNTLSNNTTTVSVLGTFSAGNGYTTGTYSDIQLIYSTGSTAISYPSATIVVGVGGTISSVTLSADNKGIGFKDTTTILTAATSSIGNGTGFTIRVSTILSGSANTAIGHQSLYSNITGSENVAIGFNSLFSNSTSSKNVAVGRNTLYYNSTGGNNTSIGYYSSFNNTTGSNNTALGYQSLYNNTTGSNNTALGNSSLGTNKSGIENIAIGINTLLGTTASSYNTAIGSKALQTLEFGNYNIAIGSNSAFYSTTNILGSPQSLTQSSNSVYIGADIRPIENQTNQIVIGYGATGNGSDSVTLGADTITKTILKGNVGIGLTGPSTKLHIYSTTSGAFRLEDGTQGPGKVLVSDATGVASWASFSSSTSIYWYTENTTPPSTTPVATGAGSIAIGNNTKALSSNMFVYGDSAGLDATGSDSSNFIGYYAGFQTHTSININIIGNYAGFQSPGSSFSNFIGNYAGFQSQNSSNSNFIGNNAGLQSQNSSNSNFFGESAGKTAPNAIFSNFFGSYAGQGSAYSEYSNFFGDNAGQNTPYTGYSNFFGRLAGKDASGASYSNFFGRGAGQNSGGAYQSNFIGDLAGHYATSAYNSNFLGSNAGSGANNANNSNFLGKNAGLNSYGAYSSNFFGREAGGAANYNISHNSNFFGDNAGFDANNAYNSNFFGERAGKGAYNGNNSNFFGQGAGQVADPYAYVTYDGSYYSYSSYAGGNNSNFIGTNAGLNSGSNNSNFFGQNSGEWTFLAHYSNFFGYYSGAGANSAEYSNFFGYGAGQNATGASNSNLFGFSAGKSFTSNIIGSNNIVIGTNISLPNGASNSINLGGVLFGLNTYSDTNGDPSIVAQPNGRIGINVVNPTTNLHVYGTQSGAFRLEDTTQGPGYVLTSDVNGVGSWTSSVPVLTDYNFKNIDSSLVSGTYSVLSTDYTKTLVYTGTSSISVVLSTGTTYSVGRWVNILQKGAGQITIAANGFILSYSSDELPTTFGANSLATVFVYNTSTPELIVSGKLKLA